MKAIKEKLLIINHSFPHIVLCFQTRFFLFSLLLLFFLINYFSFLNIVLVLAGLPILYKLSTKSLHIRTHAYWFFLVVFVYLSMRTGLKLYKLDQSFRWSLVMGIMFLIVGLEIYLISSPIFFPIVQWWEYDFRKKRELNILILREGASEGIRGRLTDIRRQAACVLSFTEFSEGELIKVIVDSNIFQLEVKANIVTQKEFSYGRGFIYGIDIKMESDTDKMTYQKLRNYWIQ